MNNKISHSLRYTMEFVVRVAPQRSEGNILVASEQNRPRTNDMQVSWTL